MLHLVAPAGKLARAGVCAEDRLEDSRAAVASARVCGALFCASYYQTLFVQARDAFLASPTAENRAALLAIIAAEKRLAEDALVIMYRDARVGYEAANHYYFSRTSLMEKIINCAWLERYFG